VVQFFGKKGILKKITGYLIKTETDGEGNGDGATVLVMTPEMITPLDKPISTSRAALIYKKYMLKVGYMDKSDVSDFVRSLKEDMAEREEELKYEIKTAKEQVAEAKSEVKIAKKKLSKCKDDDEREYAQEELATATVELEEEISGYEIFTAELALFKKDKRDFLLNYINCELHGDDWQEGGVK
jgi:actin-related protein